MKFHSHIFATIAKLPFFIYLFYKKSRIIYRSIKENNLEIFSQPIKLTLNWYIAYDKNYRNIINTKKVENILKIYNECCDILKNRRY